MIRDPGLQAERTALAWNRTALAVLVNALLSLRSGLATGAIEITALAAMLLAASACAVLYGALRRKHLLSLAPEIAPSERAILFATLLAIATSGVGLWSVLA